MGLTELLLVVAVLGGIIAVLYPTLRGAARDARQIEATEIVEGRSEDPDPEMLELEERRLTILRSLDEIAADHEAGNLNDADYAEMRARYEREAVEILRELESVGRPSRGTSAPQVAEARTEARALRGRSRLSAAVAWTAATIAFAALAGVVLTSALRPRQEGGTITGTVPGAAGGGMSGSATAGAGGALEPVDSDRLVELEKKVAQDSTDVPALVELSHMYLATQRFGDAAHLSMKALDLDPHQPEALAHLGMVLVAVNRVEDGKAALDRALQQDPDFPEALLYRGIVAFQQQDYKTAIDAWEHYLKVAPPDANVSRVRGMLEGARQASKMKS